jgi:predicted alpha/beta-fold hydrolase
MTTPHFRPVPLLSSPHLQTFVGNFFSLARAPASEPRLVALPDGDRLALQVSTPAGWREDGPTVVLVHGLCGSDSSTYMMRQATKLVRGGVRAVRLNLRGNGSGEGLARRPYHGGCSDDVRAALEDLRAAWPRSPMSLVGFSLGGNIVLKLAGELGAAGPDLLAQVVAVCPAIDLYACWRRIRQWPLYERRFVNLLRAEMVRRHALTREPYPTFERPPSLFEFDDAYTAPRVGFAGARAYYDGSSAVRVIASIAVPCRVLYAEDDPIIDADVLRDAPFPPGSQLVRSARGGHLGFVGLSRRGVRWMDEVVLGWVGPAKAPAGVAGRLVARVSSFYGLGASQ